MKNIKRANLSDYPDIKKTKTKKEHFSKYKKDEISQNIKRANFVHKKEHYFVQNQCVILKLKKAVKQ